MKEDQDSSKQVYGRSPGCEVNAQARIDTLVSTRATQSMKRNRQEPGYAKLPEEQLRENQQELETREKKRKVEDVQSIRRIVHENDRKQETQPHAKRDGQISFIMTSRSCSACGKDGTGTTTKAGGLIQSCAPKRDEKCAYARRGRHPSRQDGRRLTRDNQESQRAREVDREGPELCASTPPLKALKAVLSEVATGTRGEKVVALVDVRRAYCYAPARKEEYLSNCHQRITSQVTNTCAGCCNTACTSRVTPHNFWREGLASTLSDLKLTRGSACLCVWKGCIKGEHIVAIVHGYDITIGGERSVVESLIKMISKKYEIKKQVLRRDPDFEKSGRILNRVIEWDRDGITIEPDQRHVREILKGLELERANHSTTLCTMEGKDESGAEKG